MFAVPVRTPAPQTFRGETTQHRSASVLIAPDGTVARLRIRYSATCRQPGYRFPNTMEVVPPFTAATPTDVTERLTLHEKLAGGGRTTQTAAITAHRASSKLWRGSFRTQVILVRHDKWLDTCRLTGVTWKARLIA